MKKDRLRPLTLLFILLISLPAWSQEVKVRHLVPASCKTGEKCLIEIEIEKKGIEGFARIQQILPEGFTAFLVNDGGSDFAFDKQKVSFIWLSLPEAPIVKVSYQVSVDAGLKGTFTLENGVFSYILDNRISKLPIPSASVEVNGPGAVATPVVVEQPRQDQPEVARVEENAEKPVAEEKPIVREEPAIVQAEPVKPVVEEQAAEKAVAVEEPARQPEPAKQDPITVVNEQKITKIEEKPIAVQPEIVQKADMKELQAEKKPEPEAVATPAEAKSDTYYRVQFSALKTFRDAESLKKELGIRQAVYYESADGWHKYSFGQWTDKSEAEAACKAHIAKTGKNAFVVTYKGGRRI